MKPRLCSFPTAIIAFLFGLTAVLLITGAEGWLNKLPEIESPVSQSPIPNLVTDPALPTNSDVEETKAVYAAILSLDQYRSTPTVLDEFTERGGVLEDGAVTSRNICNADEHTIANFELRNRDLTSLRDIYRDQAGIVFFTKKDDDALARNKSVPFEQKFAKRFQGARAVISLSNVGFNPAHTEALVYVSYYCGSLCAGGSFIVLKKKANMWSVDARQEMWVS